jgi:hypothetical protein
MVLAWLVWRRPCSPSRHFLDGNPAGSLSPNSRPRLPPSRSSPTVLAETPVDWSALTRIRSGKPPRARWSAATFFGLYRIMTSPIRQALAPPSPPAQQNYITCSGPHATALGRGGSAGGHGGRGGGRAETVDEIGQPVRAQPLTVGAKIRSPLH